MKLSRYIISALASLLLASCSNGVKPVITTNCTYADSTRYAIVGIDVDVPQGSSDRDLKIKGHLMDILIDDMQKIGENFDEISIEPFSGNKDDLAEVVTYYGKSLSTFANFLSKRDAADRSAYIPEEDLDKLMDSGTFTWTYDISLKEIDQTPKYIVFSSCDYVYLGGAHGGVSGLGTSTFSMESGEPVRQFLAPSSEEALQDALKRGLFEYAMEIDDTLTEDDYLDNYFLEEDYIPFPQYQPYPSKEGLVFVYQQYEIGPYAIGMPSFVIPYDKLMPYLTEEAKAVLF